MLTGILMLFGCAQMTASKNESAGLATAATVASTRFIAVAFTPDFKQRIYIDCMEDQAGKSVKAHFVVGAERGILAPPAKQGSFGDDLGIA
jgi:hypothetical protein